MGIRLRGACAVFVVVQVCLHLQAGLAFSQVPGEPTEALTIESALSEGRENSPRIQRAEAAAREANWSKREALSGFLPKFSLSARHFPLKKYQFIDIVFGGGPLSLPQIFPTTSATLDVVVPVFDGFQNTRRYSAGKLTASAAQSDARWTAFQVEQDIRLRFYQSLAAQRLLEVAQQNVATIQDHLRQVRNLRRGGVATNFDVLRTEVQVSESQSALLQAEDDVYLTRRRLAAAMGLEADPRPLRGDLPDPSSMLLTVRSLQPGTAFEDRTDLLAQQKRIDAAKNSQLAAESHWVPNVSLTGQFINYNNLTEQIDDWGAYRNAYSVGVLLRWELFDGFASVSRAEQAESRWYQVERDHRQALLQAPVEFDNWKRKFISNASVYEARKVDVVRSQESVRLAHVGFRAGTRTSTEVLDAELELFRARAGVVNALLGCAEARINLELAVGRGL